MSAPPREHPFARSRWAERAGAAMARMWKHGLTTRPELDPEALWAIGAQGFDESDETSIRSSEDVADFRLRLERLCQALREEAALNPMGHAMAYGQLIAAIRKRHALGRFWNDNPDIATRPIAAPILVVGQMRSGTTRVQRLLAADPRHAGTRFCNSHHPVPPAVDLRPLRARAALALARRINPWLDTMHPFGATRTDEEIGWLAASLSPATFEAQWRIPSFVGFSRGRDAGPIYREFVRILHTDAHTMGDADRPRVLKCPQFAEDIETIAPLLPGAKLVRCRRPSADILSSSVSMTASQMAFQTDRHDLDWLTQTWRETIALRAATMERAFAAFPGAVAEVDFAALNADWRAAMARVYDALDIPLTPTALSAMEAEHAKAQDDPHAHHAAQIREFPSPALS
ncbi:sulfotransferase [Qipengyuania sp. XHP0207]|uniref:sulfotransferase family protein n=1 Tax=Qipengyuania sp. XHP0207 TaxID=3038078 RepID=UPI00241DBD1C|nr:sulfotransferase [Qipengyuania sp. XHP0207]MDG5747022.1 sulfotransferase [Qipengyuania sp. XHP0207]